MALIKRGKTWHTHFFVHGQRFRQSRGKTDWREAQAKEKELIADAIAGKLSVARQRFARLPFREAAKQFLQDRMPRLAPLSVQREKAGLKVFKKIADLPVAQITPDTVRPTSENERLRESSPPRSTAIWELSGAYSRKRSAGTCLPTRSNPFPFDRRSVEHSA